jgi:hypothetical protein
MESNASRKTTSLRGVTKALAAAAVIGLALTGCGAASGSGEGGSRQLLLGHGADPSNPRSVAADFFKEHLAEITEGQLTVQVQGSEQLGSDSEMMVSLASGTLDLTANSQGAVSSNVPEMALFGLPFLFESVTRSPPRPKAPASRSSPGGTTASGMSPTASAPSTPLRTSRDSKSARRTTP